MQTSHYHTATGGELCLMNGNLVTSRKTFGVPPQALLRADLEAKQMNAVTVGGGEGQPMLFSNSDSKRYIFIHVQTLNMHA